MIRGETRLGGARGKKFGAPMLELGLSDANVL